MPVRPRAHKPPRPTGIKRIERKEDKAHRNGARSWGNGRGGRKWRDKRERIFSRDHYLCQECKRQGKVTAVALSGTNHGICDHVINKQSGGTDSEDNLQTLCQACSKAKTMRESSAGRKR